MAIDGVSWRILQEDFATAYQQLTAGAAVDLPRSDSYLSWAAACARVAASPELQRQAAYWLAIDQRAGDDRLALRGEAASRYRETVSEELVLDPARTAQLLRAANAAYRTTPEDLLLAALARALQRWRGIDAALLLLEGHGREDLVEGVDISRTVGWFTSIYPFALQLRADRDLGYQIKAIKEDLRAVPNRGVGYGLLRYLSGGAVTLDGRPQISFNYLGHFDAVGDADSSAFRVSPIGGSAGVNPLALRPCELDVSALVIGDDAIVEFQFNPARLPVSDAARLRQAFSEELNAVLDHCIGLSAPELTPADLTYSALSLDELDELFE
jgi:non-ribosomal peptide synthase protein (TIGR01720 family)